MKKLITCLLLLTTHSSLAAEQHQPYASAEPYDIAAFVQKIDDLRKDAKIPGLSVAVVKDHAILLATGLGFADMERSIPATAETPYDIASVAKPLSAAVALRLVEEGLLDLDEPLVNYSEWKEFCNGFSQQPTILAKGLHCQSSAHTLRHLLSHTATGTPGTHFSYNPVLYSWASRPIMAVADGSFSSLVKQYDFAPADMTMSARKYRDLPLREDLAKQQAQPYRIDSTGTALPAAPRRPQGDGAAGGVVSTVIDLAKFDIALDQGKLISAKSRKEMMTPTRLRDGKKAPYGLGWFIQEYKGNKLVWHSGWWDDAYSALYLKVPKKNLSFIILANSEGVWWDNPPERAEVERSLFAQAFLSAFVDR
ncbi:serine hydrolase domain-containing protein [Microbulbifer hainanensis]|uniref:serine hydrolase domain-containing protein n=1 Tax=Microbulbifer hainanensis TaxID=2735675 RepID=UPI0018661B32|nr:serine hydrolase domain-containing protein [Microbulbifer hainanensis]